MKQRKINYKDIVTKFGKITVNLESVIHFQHGLVGMPFAKNFCMTHYPDDKNNLYKLLQSIDDEKLCFITIPLPPSYYESDASLIKNEDLLAAVKFLNYNKNHVQVVLIATIHNQDNEYQVSVNLKAPIIIDSLTMRATQYIFHSPCYSIQHYI